MGQAYPIKVREKAGAFALKHGSSGKAAEAYEVSRASAVRWAAQLRETGKITVGKIGGYRKPILEGQEEWLRARMLQGPHVTLKQVRGELVERGLVVSHGALWNFVKRLGLSFKKTVHAEEATRPDVARKRIYRWT